jgi:hypothetical protein
MAMNTVSIKNGVPINSGPQRTIPRLLVAKKWEWEE